MPKRKVEPGVNDLGSVAPNLALEWHPTKNVLKTAQEVYAKSETKAFWLCSNNPIHEWEAVISSRIRGAGCPYCSNQRVLKGDNDLATTHPGIARLWDSSRNLGIGPEQITAGSNKSFWWLCTENQNHTWKAPPARLKSGTGCPYCSGRSVSAGESDLATTDPSLAKTWDATKNGSLQPSQVKSGSNKLVWWLCEKDSRHSWKASVASRAKAGRGCPFCSNQKVLEGFNDLATTHPLLANEWSERNSPLTPSQVLSGSDRKVWWICDQGHDYHMSLHRRVGGATCNICAGKVVVKGINDLASSNQDHFQEWDYAANDPLDPASLTPGSNRPVWWRCKKDSRHTWRASPNTRKKRGCPVCSGNKIVAGLNDLATLMPELAKEFSTDLNHGLSPSQISVASPRKFWWVCSANSKHIWETSASNRTRRGDGCPICSNSKVLSGFNDLMTKFPGLVNEWDWDKNAPLSPSEVLFGSDRKVWWTCSKDARHGWLTKVSSRTAHDSGCPVCANLVIIEGVNDLVSTQPDLAKSWHPSKNLPIKPTEIGAGTHKAVWWWCETHPEHVWKAPVVMRLRGTGCPYCSNQKVFSGFNDLATISPSVAADWHPTKNGSVKPSQVAPRANKKYWWKCFNDPTHEWQATPNSRTFGSNCPRCANSGYDTSRRGVFYFIEHEELRANKIGITNPDRNSNRLTAWQKAGWTVVSTYESDNGLLILNLETNLLRWIRKDLGFPPFLTEGEMKPLGGWSETFSYEALTHDEFMLRFHQELENLDKKEPLFP